MKEEIYKKSVSELDRAIAAAGEFEQLSASQIRKAVWDAANSVNTFMSAIYGKSTTMDKEYLVLDYHIKAKRLIRDLSELYFLLKKISEKEFKKISRNQVKVFGWKNVDILDKTELIVILNNMNSMMEKIWTAQKYSK